MFPIRDDAPKFTTPYVTFFLIAVNTAVWIFEFSLPRQAQFEFITQFGVIPAAVQAAFAGAIPITYGIVPLFTSMFLHGSWMHLIFNMWGLWIFGDNLEDHLGHFKYLVFYLLTGISGSLLHIFFNLGSTVPSVGASGAIAGVMGGYFLLFSSARVLTLIPILFIWRFIWLPAWLVLGFWFIGQFVSGAAETITYAGNTAGGVAFWAHVGGFAAGAAVVKLFPSRPPSGRYA
jgi:membrane associated rhomboid family serine protease